MAKNLKVGMLVCASLLAANAAYADNSATQESLRIEQQTSKIKGTIVDSKTGEPIIGASVKVKGTKLATITDIDGNFELNAPEGAQLQVSYVGYKNEEFEARNGMKIEIHEDSDSLLKIVVVGFVTQKK